MSSYRSSGSSGPLSRTPSPVSSVQIRAIVCIVFPRPEKSNASLSDSLRLASLQRKGLTHLVGEDTAPLQARRVARGLLRPRIQPIRPSLQKIFDDQSSAARKGIDVCRTCASRRFAQSWLGGSSGVSGSLGCSMRIIQARPCNCGAGSRAQCFSTPAPSAARAEESAHLERQQIDSHRPVFFSGWTRVRRKERRVHCADFEKVADQVGSLGLFDLGRHLEERIRRFVLEPLVSDKGEGQSRRSK